MKPKSGLYRVSRVYDNLASLYGNIDKTGKRADGNVSPDSTAGTASPASPASAASPSPSQR